MQQATIFMRICCSIVVVCSTFFLSGQIQTIEEKLSNTHQSESIAIDQNVYYQKMKTDPTGVIKNVQLTVFNEMRTFNAVPNGVVDEAFRQVYADIQTYDLYNVDDPKMTGTMTISPFGLYANLKYQGQLIAIYPDNAKGNNHHIIEYGLQKELKLDKKWCGHDHSFAEMVKSSSSTGARNMGITIGSKRYNYRVAIVTTGEFYLKNGNNDAQVTTVVVNSVNAIGAIFNTEMSFRFTVGNRIFLYRDPNTDPFTPDDLAGAPSRPDQAGTVVALNFTPDLYDIGHVFHTHEDGDNWSSGGVARLRSVCNNFGTIISKASAWSGSRNNLTNDWINLAAHEFGHQFGANHTFNGIGSSCTDAIAEQNSFEIGSGTTIMSYNGICDPDQNIPSSGVDDNYFHTKSLEEMFEYVYNGNGGSCGNPQNAANPIPEVVANPCNATYRLPKNTPFYVNAKGNFTDGDNHTYCWEQIDEDNVNGTPTQGFIGFNASNNANGPLFRSFPPSTNSDRYFPSLNVLSTGGVNDFEVLPNVPRVIKLNVALRDNNPSGGATDNDDIALTVSNSGPFVVTRPNGGETLQAGTMQTITWSTGGSNSLCNNIRIKLSTDGGKTFPLVIAENVPYASGSYVYSIPSNFVASSQAKILLECMDFDCFKFFNLSKSNFNISSPCNPENSVLCSTTKVTQDEGSPNLNLSVAKVVGQQLFSVSRNMNDQLDVSHVSVKGIGGVGCAKVSDYYYSRINIYVTESGTYNFNVVGAGFATIYTTAFDTEKPCQGFVTSSATTTNGSSITRSANFSAQLTQCTEYVVLLYTFTNLPLDLSFNVISGPGIVLEKASTPSTVWQNIFVLVDNTTDNIVYAGNNTDFRTTSSGMYTLYSAMVNINLNPQALINQKYSTINNTNCLNPSYNSKQIEIRSTCKITDVTPGSQGACVPASNFYFQNLVITYDKSPTSGQLNVNGQLFDITGSPQSVTLTNLDANGLPQDVNVFFTASPNCKFSKNAVFTAPGNCCPITLNLGNDQSKCEGETTVLNAGNDGVSYKWFRNGVEIVGQLTNTLQVSSTGLYKVEVVHALACMKVDEVNIIFNAKPTILLPPNSSFCEGETFTINSVNQGANQIKWFRNEIEIGGAIGPNLDVISPGTYRIEVTSPAGCKETKSLTITQLEAPNVELGMNIQKCEGEKQTIVAGNEGITYTWFRDNILVTGQVNSTLEVTQSGLYRVIVTGANQCDAEDQVKIDFFASPVVQDLPSNIDLCEGESHLFTANASDFQSLQWFFQSNPINGANMLTLQATNEGKYEIEATNLAGCKTKKASQITSRFKPTTNITETNIVSCIGSNVVLDAGNDGKTYVWSRNNVVLPNSSKELTVTQDGLYKIIVTSDFNCVTTQEVNISFISGPSVSLNGDATICEGESHTIAITTNATNPQIQWFLNGTLIPNTSGLNFDATLDGVYQVEVNAGNPPCKVSKSITLKVNPLPAFDLGNDKLLCEGDPAPTLNAGTGNNIYEWKKDGANLANTASVIATTSGNYSVKVTNNFNCTKTEDIRVTYNPLPSLEVVNALDLCPESTLMLEAISNGSTFEWRRNNVIIANETKKTLSVNSAGSYNITAVSNQNCKVNKTVVVTARPAPTVDLGANFTLCPEQSKTLNAGQHTSYLWSDGSSNPSLVVNAEKPTVEKTTSYKVTVTNNFGCTSKDSVLATLYAIVVAKIEADKTGVCNGEPVTLTASGGENFLWTDPDGNTLSSIDEAVTIASPTVTTTYSVEVVSANCPDFKDNETIEVKVFDASNISAGLDTCVVLGRTIKLLASGGVAYQWDNTDLIVGPSNIANPVVKPVVETTFKVTVTDANGCIFTDDVAVCVKEDVFKPISIITPNGDGKNDELLFGGLEDYPDNTLQIFNRWGTLIFDAAAYQLRGETFKGLRNGDRLPADTYYYVLKFGDRTVKSALTILWD